MTSILQMMPVHRLPPVAPEKLPALRRFLLFQAVGAAFFYRQRGADYELAVVLYLHRQGENPCA